MVVEMGPSDAREMMLAISRTVRERLSRRLPDRLGAIVAPAPDAA